MLVGGMSRYAFFHLPKTGGTSLDEALRAILSVSPPFWPDDPLPPEVVSTLQPFDLVSGHLSYTDYAAHFADRKTLTVLRDPVDRCLSWYWFCRNSVPDAAGWERVAAAKRLSPEDYFSLPGEVIFHNCINAQVRQLGGHRGTFEDDTEAVFDRARRTVDDMLWVGFTETLERDVSELRRLPDFARLPALGLSNGARRDAAPSAELRAIIEERNRFDMKLYEHAKLAAAERSAA